jgi:hypothetical protein
MKKYGFSVAIIALFLTLIGPGPSPTKASFQDNEEIIKGTLFFFGPAENGMRSAGLTPSGSFKLIPGGDTEGIDTLKVSVEGLPPHTCFTLFLHELNDIPFGASEYLAEMCTNKKGKASVTVNAVIKEAFALVTRGNPPTQTPVNVDMNHLVLWFADSKDDDAFTNFPPLAFDGDRDSGVAVLRTNVPLP